MGSHIRRRCTGRLLPECYAMPGTDCRTVVRACYAMPRLRTCYVMPRTDVMHGAVSCYALAMRCPVLMKRMVLRQGNGSLFWIDPAVGAWGLVGAPYCATPVLRHVRVCCYEMSGTDVTEAICYEMSGTDVAYAATRY
eukprot:437392-Rhodomonas_salina.3